MSVSESVLDGHPGGCDEVAYVHGMAVRNLQQILADHGLEFAKLAKIAGVTLCKTQEWERHQFPLKEYTRLFEQGARLLQKPTLGLDSAKKHQNTPCKAVLLAVRTARTGLAALQVHAEFSSLTASLCVSEVRRHDGFVELVWSYPPSIQLQDQLVDRTAGCLSLGLRSLLPEGGFNPVQIDLSRSVPDCQRPYRDFFGITPQFEAPVNRLVYREHDALIVRPQHDPDMHEALLELCWRKMADRKQAGTVVTHVREYVEANIGNQDLTLEDAATALGFSGRALQRHLAKRDRTFQQIHDVVRRETAVDLLENTDLAISEIGYRLGFSAVGNFTRAARRWFEMPPSAWRAARRVRSEAPVFAVQDPGKRQLSAS